MKDFVHLHVHSEYSQLDGYGTPKQYVSRAKQLGMPGIAITDHGNVDGAIKWQKECLKQGIKPIIGCELYVCQDMTEKVKSGHMTILVKGLKGFECLLRMLSKANLKGFYYRPRIDFNTILKEDEEGLKQLIFMTGCCNSFIYQPDASTFMNDMVRGGMDMYMELMPLNLDIQKKHNQYCLEWCKSLRLDAVATADCHYVLPEHKKAQEVLLAIQRKAKWTDENRWSFESSHLLSYREMCRGFERQGVLDNRQMALALMNTGIIAEKCWDFKIDKMPIELPETRYEKENPNKSPDQLLKDFCNYKLIPRESYGDWQPGYGTRFDVEITMIEKKGFARYFLIVYELLQWCKQVGIMYGPGRGSVGGSLVAWLLGITGVQVDPIRWGLLFERFISEDRIDYPDIDIDFENNKCHLVREHLEKEYGKYNVAGISTFLRLKSKAAIRDVARVFELNSKDVDQFAKSIVPQNYKKDVIINSTKETDIGRRFANKYSDALKFMDQLEGQIKSSGQHPAGLIVSPVDLTQGYRTNIVKRSGNYVANWDMEDCDYLGLMKIDVLKLDTLTVLNEVKRLVELNGEDLDYHHLPLDDDKIFKNLTAGDLEGVFQLCGYACSLMVKEMGIDSVEDMAAASGLCRPGPANSGMAENYIKRKKGYRWKPLHPAYENICKETYGVMVYQEQMMRAMVDLAGFSGNDADRIRKVISKKRDPKEFEPYKEAFLKGCEDKQTLNNQQAEKFWKGLIDWAGYGFNKAHSIQYAIIGYWTAYVKMYHPIEFICAQLTYGSNKANMVAEAHRAGLKIVTPKVGISDSMTWLNKGDYLYMPFIEINDIGEVDAEKCADYKPKKQKKGFFDLKQDKGSGKDKIERILNEIRALDRNPDVGPDDCLKNFQYDVYGKD